MSRSPDASWGEIEPSLLEDVRGPVPPFPVEVLPIFWRDWVAATARAAGAPNDYVALSVLAAVAGIAGAGARVRITPRWVEPLVLWQALVGPPSSGKSAAMAPVRDLLSALEAKPAADGTEKPRRVVEDGAIDDVAAALDAHPRGVILWRDEPVDLLAQLGCEPGARGDDALRACWLSAWSGGPVTPHKGARRLKQFPVSLLVALQPERLATLLHASHELAGRFLFTWPHAPAHVPLAARAPVHDDEAMTALRRLADRLPTLEPLGLVFDQAGLAAFDQFTARLQAERSEAEGLELAWLAKGAGTVARLAGALKLLEWSRDASGSAAGDIGKEQVERAIALWSDYFRPHALALFHHVAPTEAQRRARQVVRWLQQFGQGEVSREDVRCKALRYAVNADQAEKVLLGLQNAGVVERDVVERDSGGPSARGRPPCRWSVNPNLFNPVILGNSANSAGA